MSKRANVESSTHQDAAGRWHGWLPSGRRPPRRQARPAARVGEDAQGPVAEGSRAGKNRDTGIAHTAGRQMSFGEWRLDHWMTISERSVRPGTFVGYEGYVRNHIKPALGHHRLDKLQPEHLEAFYGDLADVKRLSPAPSHLSGAEDRDAAGAGRATSRRWSQRRR